MVDINLGRFADITIDREGMQDPIAQKRAGVDDVNFWDQYRPSSDTRKRSCRPGNA